MTQGSRTTNRQKLAGQICDEVRRQAAMGDPNATSGRRTTAPQSVGKPLAYVRWAGRRCDTGYIAGRLRSFKRSINKRRTAAMDEARIVKEFDPQAQEAKLGDKARKILAVLRMHIAQRRGADVDTAGKQS